MENKTTLKGSKHSECYRCRFKSWDLEFDPKGIDRPAWIHICKAPGDYVPGDGVKNCPGFMRIIKNA